MANQWDRIVSRNNERLRLVGQESMTMLFSYAFKLSPVDTGLFRNNWFASIGSPNTQTTTRVSRLAFGKTGGVRYTEALHITTGYDIGDQIYFTNSLPYARALEYGHSQRMAPNGVVRVAALMWPNFVSTTIRRIR